MFIKSILVHHLLSIRPKTIEEFMNESITNGALENSSKRLDENDNIQEPIVAENIDKADRNGSTSPLVREDLLDNTFENLKTKKPNFIVKLRPLNTDDFPDSYYQNFARVLSSIKRNIYNEMKHDQNILVTKRERNTVTNIFFSLYFRHRLIDGLETFVFEYCSCRLLEDAMNFFILMKKYDILNTKIGIKINEYVSFLKSNAEFFSKNDDILFRMLSDIINILEEHTSDLKLSFHEIAIKSLKKYIIIIHTNLYTFMSNINNLNFNHLKIQLMKTFNPEHIYREFVNEWLEVYNEEAKKTQLKISDIMNEINRAVNSTFYLFDNDFLNEIYVSTESISSKSPVYYELE